MMLKSKLLTAAVIFFALLFAPVKAYAVCPLCTIAVGAGVGLTRSLGVDDIISGIWFGGLVVSTLMWTLNFLKSKHKSFKYQEFIVALILYGLVVIPLMATGIIGATDNKLWGIDKLLLGIVVGSIIFSAAVFTNDQLKQGHLGKVYFPFQKVVIPLVFLLLSSLLFYFITR